jgi:hypothetical protein
MSNKDSSHFGTVLILIWWWLVIVWRQRSVGCPFFYTKNDDLHDFSFSCITMFIPWWLVSIVTFPWIVIHEWAHKKYCDRTWVKVLEVVYFQIWNPAWYVIHEEPKEYNQTFRISIWPLIINSIVTLSLSYFATQTIVDSSLYLFLFWLALSSWIHAFPSDQDASNIFDRSKRSLKNWGSKLHVIAYPFYALIWLANKLRFFWFDLIYAVVLMYFWSWWTLFN